MYINCQVKLFKFKVEFKNQNKFSTAPKTNIKVEIEDSNK